MFSSRPRFRTKLCDLLGIGYPILQSGMGGVAGPDLAAEVSNAGGLGIIAGFAMSADQLRNAIRQLRSRSDKPFGVNLLIPNEVQPPSRQRPFQNRRSKQFTACSIPCDWPSDSPNATRDRRRFRT